MIRFQAVLFNSRLRVIYPHTEAVENGKKETHWAYISFRAFLLSFALGGSGFSAHSAK